MAPAYENRRFMRSPVDLPVTVTSGDEEIIEGLLRNVSITGVYVETMDHFAEGAECKLSFEAAPLKEVELTCSILHHTATGMGMEIVGIERESFENFRELIVRHAADPVSCDTEILSNMGSLPSLY